jgi:hypothetical protein
MRPETRVSRGYWINVRSWPYATGELRTGRPVWWYRLYARICGYRWIDAKESDS